MWQHRDRQLRCYPWPLHPAVVRRVGPVENAAPDALLSPLKRGHSMMNLNRTGVVVSAIALLFGSQVFADGKFDASIDGERNFANAGYPPNFQAFCEGDLTADRQAKFDNSLAKAEAALASGDVETAGNALQSASAAAYRGFTDLDYGKSRKCLGEAKARRYFKADLDYHLRRKARGDQAIPLWAIAADSGAEGMLLELQGERVNRYSRAYAECNEIVRQYQIDSDYGAFMLSEEEAVMAACKTLQTEVKGYARTLHDEAMAAETVAFSREATDQERAVAADMSAMGEYMGSTMDAEQMLTKQRVGESMDQLQEARAWNFGLDTADGGLPRDPADTPESQRALQRGNVLLSKAEDTSIDVVARDDNYALAIDYYDFGYQKEAARKARAAREAIQPQLAASRQQTEAKRDAVRKEMEGKLENAAAAMEDMKKTEAEKESFNAEADALEAELGF